VNLARFGFFFTKKREFFLEGKGCSASPSASAAMPNHVLQPAERPVA
jgi:hypothetical protein